MREVEHWKRVSQHHKQQESTTRDELAKANQRAAELQRQLGEKQHEVVSLTEARNVALNQISTLKKHAAQLQNFKKNISNMLQAEAGLDGPLSSINVQGMLDSLPVDSTFSSTLPSPALETYNRPANLAVRTLRSLELVVEQSSGVCQRTLSSEETIAVNVNDGVCLTSSTAAVVGHLLQWRPLRAVCKCGTTHGFHVVVLPFTRYVSAYPALNYTGCTRCRTGGDPRCCHVLSAGQACSRA